MIKLGEIEILDSICNPETLIDGRGAIFSWITRDSIKEFTLLFFHPNKSRGNHFHPEFVEYFLVLEGVISLTTKDPSSGKKISTIGGVGFCFRTPKLVPHLVQAVTTAKCISMITKPWDSCDKPIIYEDLN
jgi:mannose-6-phosphate isomerase-like protein (cupin superfamily)